MASPDLATLEQDALATAREAGVHCIPLPTPFAVNAYLIEDSPLTLVDCGPDSATTLGALERGLAQLGHTVEEIGLIILTHQHLDHIGLAETLRARSGAAVACHVDLAPVMPRWDEHAALDDDDAHELMVRHGVEPHVAEALRAMATIVSHWGHRTSVSRTLADGEAVQLRDRRLEVVYRPGHSPSDIVLLDDARGLAFTGDHLLSRISSNAVISRPLTGDTGRRPSSLLDYRRSLAQTRELPFQIGLGGHRGPVVDPRGLIDRRLVEQERRAERFYEVLAAGPMCAHEIAEAQWGPVATTQAFLTLSEVLGAMDLLIEQGRVIEDDGVAPVRFRRA